MSAYEAGDGLTAAEDGDRGDALDPVLHGEHLLGLHVDLGELELALALGHLGLDGRTEDAARSAPGGPEVDDDRDLVRALDHLALEALRGYVHVRAPFG